MYPDPEYDRVMKVSVFAIVVALAMYATVIGFIFWVVVQLLRHFGII